MAISKERKNEIIEAVKEAYETGHCPKNAERADMTKEEYELFVELYSLGPAGFLEEFWGELDFDPDYVTEYGQRMLELEAAEETSTWYSREVVKKAIKNKLHLDDEDAEIVYDLWVNDNSLDEFENVEEFEDYLRVNTCDILASAIDDALAGGSENTARELMRIQEFIEG